MANSSVEQAKPGSVDVWLDPQEAFERFQADIDHFAALDPNIARVQEALKARFEEIPEEDAIRVMALAWPQVKAILSPVPSPRGFPTPPGFPPWPLWPPWPPWPPYPPEPPVIPPWYDVLTDGSVPRSLVALRHGLVEGEALRRRVEADLEGPLAADALRNTAKEIKEWEHTSNSARTREFDVARDELERMVTGPERKLVGVLVGLALGFAVGYGIGYLVSHPQ
ncbi:hypothetical protein [Streptomyces coffeae]|uniref:Uncharacterized protein n=1 Tax=Streptomyces coffeae TaxID=621382 RepID=A0ABS1NN63_9ACTN|nr:hypothetical protein [Streptomyces coffeae]MBL1101522.1 hypothetical protein [Streptomyces coffeae]